MQYTLSDLETLNINKLKEICKENKIRGYSSLRKKYIIQLILDSKNKQNQNDNNKNVAFVVKYVTLDENDDIRPVGEILNL